MVREFRRFPVATSGTEWLLDHGLESMEQPIGIVSGRRPYYRVRGRTKNGKRWITVATLSIVGTLLAGVADDGDWTGSRRAPRSVIFGHSTNCAAVVCRQDPAHDTHAGMWAITDTRIRYVEFASMLSQEDRSSKVARVGYEHLPVEPVKALIRAEFRAADFQRHPGVTRTFGRRFKERVAAYDRYLLHDGSGVDFHTEAIQLVAGPGDASAGAARPEDTGRN